MATLPDTHIWWVGEAMLTPGGGVVADGTTCPIWTSKTGGVQETDLYDESAVPITAPVVTSGRIGLVGVPKATTTPWVDSGSDRYILAQVDAYALVATAQGDIQTALAEANSASADAGAALTAASAYATVAVGDVPLTRRSTLNFVGAVTVTDDSGTGATDVTVLSPLILRGVATVTTGTNVSIGQPGLTWTDVPGMTVNLPASTPATAWSFEVDLGYEAGTAQDAGVRMVFPSDVVDVLAVLTSKDGSGGMKSAAIIANNQGEVILGAGAATPVAASIRGRFLRPTSVTSQTCRVQMRQNGTEAVDIKVYKLSTLVVGQES